jgi:F0F1-type ATP synthase assembly protein I
VCCDCKGPRPISGTLTVQQLEFDMSIIAWIILGLIAGFVASKLVNRRGEGVILDVLLGIVGSVVGGWLFHSVEKAA